jgi:hypothetical protein
MTASEARNAPYRFCRDCAWYTHELYQDMTGDGGRGIEATGECSICGERYDEPGWYRVDGLRHSAVAHATSAAEAVRLAVEAKIIGDWEMPTARWWTDELPVVFSA